MIRRIRRREGKGGSISFTDKNTQTPRNTQTHTHTHTHADIFGFSKDKEHSASHFRNASLDARSFLAVKGAKRKSVCSSKGEAQARKSLPLTPAFYIKHEAEFAPL